MPLLLPPQTNRLPPLPQPPLPVQLLPLPKLPHRH